MPDANTIEPPPLPPAIPTPPRRTALPYPEISQRRQSLPARTSTAHGQSRPGTRHVPPASPEVISSLISSLSAISTPARTHFDNLPNIGSRTVPSSPNFSQTEFSHHDVPPPVPTSPGFGMDYGAYKNLADDDEHDFLHPDDAAASPVVRMSKPPPSPRSPRTPRSPRGTPGDSSPRRPTSKASFTSSKMANDDFSGIGIVSLEPGPPPRRSTTASIASSSSGGRKSLRSPLGLLKRASREFYKDKEHEHLSVADRRLNSSRSRQSLRSTPSMADLAEEGTGVSTEQVFEKLEEFGPRDGSISMSPSRPMTETGSPSPGGIGSGRSIPTRESSLRHSYNGPSSKKRRSVRHSTYSHRDFTIDRDIAEVKAEDDQVTKRIKEIKQQQQKVKDELATDGSPSGVKNPTPKPSSQQVTQEVVFTDSFAGTQTPKTDEPYFMEEESAPSPTVLTRKTTTGKKRNSSGPLSSKTANIQPPLGKQQSLEKPDSQKLLKRRSNPAHASDANNPPLSPVPRMSSTTDDRPSSSDSIDDAVDAYLASPRLTQKVTHPQTGRIIAFSEVGDPNGYVVICCVGMGLTRYLTAFYDELAWTLKLRLITPDRPGVGESEPCMDGSGTPLSWPDDVAIICNSLKITKFSMLAHSAGAIYALATALRLPQHIRGRLHLLAPWIPPSQMSSMGPHKEPVPSNAVPYSQRILRALPTPFLKVANSSFMSATSASITTSLPKSPKRTKRRNTTAGKEVAAAADGDANGTSLQNRNSAARPSNTFSRPPEIPPSFVNGKSTDPQTESLVSAAAAAERERQSVYDNRLTHAIWASATTNANPAVDLLICLERRQTIGFRYVDITRAVVIHHGSKDTRVPVENVRWLGKTMRRCEVRVLEGEGHGLMASAAVMGNVLMEVAKEWEDWTTVVQGRRDGTRRATATNR